MSMDGLPADLRPQCSGAAAPESHVLPNSPATALWAGTRDGAVPPRVERVEAHQDAQHTEPRGRTVAPAAVPPRRRASLAPHGRGRDGAHLPHPTTKTRKTSTLRPTPAAAAGPCGKTNLPRRMWKIRIRAKDMWIAENARFAESSRNRSSKTWMLHARLQECRGCSHCQSAHRSRSEMSIARRRCAFPHTFEAPSRRKY